MAKSILAVLMMISALGTLGTVAVTVAGCNTVAGAGKDVEHGGAKIQEEAKETQKKM